MPAADVCVVVDDWNWNKRKNKKQTMKTKTTHHDRRKTIRSFFCKNEKEEK